MERMNNEENINTVTDTMFYRYLANIWILLYFMRNKIHEITMKYKARIEIHYKCFICLIEHSLNFKFILQNILIVTKSITDGFYCICKG